MTLGYDQRMPFANRIFVRYGEKKLILGQIDRAIKITKWTGHFLYLCRQDKRRPHNRKSLIAIGIAGKNMFKAVGLTTESFCSECSDRKTADFYS